MKRQLKGAAALAVLALILGGTGLTRSGIEQPPAQAAARQAPTPLPPVPQPERRPGQTDHAAAPSHPADNAEVGWEDDDEYHVLPNAGRQPLTCRETYRPSGSPGTVSETLDCDESDNGGVDHPYQGFDDESLAALAVSDAAAAQILGRRLIYEDPRRARRLYLRATALSGKPGPLLELLQSPISVTHIDGEPQLNNMRSLLVLAEVAHRMGYPDDLAGGYAEQLAQHVSEPEVEALRTGAADQLLATINEQRARLIGEPLHR